MDTLGDSIIFVFAVIEELL